ncbi:MAG TPA: 50S ribosomal protein L31 [Polyangia bacterium]|nr:50S ribosomal protein L31 [Polyangia bacterium]
MPKPGIHPAYSAATITCACGATYPMASTRGSFAVEICASCHPFYTGKQKLMDTAGRIERFQKKYGRGSKSAE